MPLFPKKIIEGKVTPHFPLVAEDRGEFLSRGRLQDIFWGRPLGGTEKYLGVPLTKMGVSTLEKRCSASSIELSICIRYRRGTGFVEKEPERE